ncbi:iron-sulfur cluster assembly protein [Salinigranum marinum]|uniref:iron-sulfur cluster assembly protein n=1 Tax=Salinigranum marinum TaxID=1515595 RepID=UPI002989C18B|nr:iron-sulfur cluster assembly protein [Salinigranum marinum]
MSTTPTEVRTRLDRVTDPELDESIVELDYVDEIEIGSDEVTVRFTLPTAWCSPAFAWMMATDARDELESLPDVETAHVYLRDHMHETEINEGVNERRSFGESFPDADGGVASVRATLDDKARLSRQYAAVETLLDAGVSAEQLCGLTPGDLEIDAEPRADGARAAVYLAGDAFAVTVAARPLDRYLVKAREVGAIEANDDPLFRTPEGGPIDPDQFELVHRRGRLARTNMTGQGGVCDALNESRRRKLDRESTEVVDAD